MTEASHAVFLSYASQDAEAAQKICEALRAAGIEVWFDQSELRGGDAWDRQIRERIHNCRLFIALISKNTEARDEGYFRREWRLAVERAGDMSEKKAFLLPVAIDATPERGSAVPDKFHHIQWTRLPSGEAPPEFVAHVKRLLSQEPANSDSSAHAGGGPSPIPLKASRPSPFAVAVAALLLGAFAYLALNKPWIAKPASPPATSNSATTPAAFNPPLHSIAVLPFANISGDKDQDYFSDGLTEELLNSLAAIDGLQVAARTSAFSFKEHPNIGTVAHELNVASVLEGSVRRSGNTVRITTQLINAATGFHLWSHTYDRNLGDVLKLQTEIATAVAEALKVTLLGDVAEKIELGGTHNPAAFDAYLRGRKASQGIGAKSDQAAIAAYTEAIGLDPNYALAFAARSTKYSSYAGQFVTGAAIREFFDNALADARKALTLAPDLPEGHLALGVYFDHMLDFARASEAYDRARTLAPGNAQVLRASGMLDGLRGYTESGLSALRRAVALDPLNPRSHSALGEGLYRSRRYQEAAAAATEAISLDSDYQAAYAWRGLAEYALRDLEHARASCEAKPEYWVSRWCLAVTYDKLGRHAEAEAELANYRAVRGDGAAYQYATIYAQWGNTPKALEWLDTAMRLRDSGLGYLKTDPLMDPLRHEPRFQAAMRELKFPD